MNENQNDSGQPTDEDTEGHRRVMADGGEDDTEGHRRAPGGNLAEDDTEGHRRAPGGNLAEDDTEGHVQPRRDTDIDR